ncbi:MAG: hypothetical protein KOO63_08555 [Bacteroidales bacterium]|nr:hypothetical protein [Candidatus Latescibacterota bacterium]
MYSIEKKDYGLRIVEGGIVGIEEALELLSELKAEIEKVKRPFQIFVDMRTLLPLSEEVQKVFVDAHILVLANGMNRSVAILKDNLVILQHIKTSKETGLDQVERYISALDNPDWEQQGLDWILDGKEPTG